VNGPGTLALLAAAEAHPLAHVDAVLNALATILLLAGYVLIKQQREMAHRNAMLLAFAVSVVFLLCYLTHHYLVGTVKFEGQGSVRSIYYPILLSHIVLAAAVPFLAVATICLGLRDRRAAHIRLARITFPIWLYVSVTGVIVYWMLYHL